MSKEDLAKTLHLHKGFHKCNMHTFIHTCAYINVVTTTRVSICYKDERAENS